MGALPVMSGTLVQTQALSGLLPHQPEGYWVLLEPICTSPETCLNFWDSASSPAGCPRWGLLSLANTVGPPLHFTFLLIPLHLEVDL